jgi:hypothetical protein
MANPISDLILGTSTEDNRRTKGLLPASWRGIAFFVKNEVLVEGGRRIILHEYPNSSERFVEDLGRIPPKFTITAFVSGADFAERANQLELALKRKGRGWLSMPTFGIKRLFAMPYKKDASQTAVGEIRFDLSFVDGQGILKAHPAAATAEEVYSWGDRVRKALGDALDGVWGDISSGANALTSQFDVTSFTNSAGQLSAIVSNAQTVLPVVNLITTNVASITQSGSLLSNSFVGNLCQKLSEGLSGGQGISALLDLTRFGSDLSLSLSDIRNAIPVLSSDDSSNSYRIPLWKPTTADRARRNKNRLSFVNTGRIAFLAAAYEQAADATYSTDAEIEETRLNLETAHQRLMRVDTSDKDSIQAQPEIRSTVESIRLAALRVLDQKEQSAFSLTTVNNRVAISSYVEAYSLYAEDFTAPEDVTAKAIEIRSLNPTLAADRLIGTTTVLQA